jgi:hypothetical protein
MARMEGMVELVDCGSDEELIVDVDRGSKKIIGWMEEDSYLVVLLQEGFGHHIPSYLRQRYYCCELLIFRYL